MSPNPGSTCGSTVSRSPRKQRRDWLDEQIKRLSTASGGTYGSPRIARNLRDAGWKVSINTLSPRGWPSSAWQARHLDMTFSHWAWTREPPLQPPIDSPLEERPAPIGPGLLGFAWGVGQGDDPTSTRTHQIGG
jgi:hypothetical protein